MILPSVLKREIIRITKIVSLLIFISLGIYLYSWTGPSASAPNSNTSAPVNVGSVNQVKSGGLGVTNFVADNITTSTTTSNRFCIGSSCITSWSQGVTSLSAGSGISVSGGTGNVTISNTNPVITCNWSGYNPPNGGHVCSYNTYEATYCSGGVVTSIAVLGGATDCTPQHQTW